MMRGIAYDDNYIGRKMHSYDLGSPYTHSLQPHGYGQDGGYLNVDDDTKLAGEDAYDTEKYTSPLVRPGYAPSAKTKLILNRVAMSQPRGLTPMGRGLPSRMGPPPPSYYDYDYGGYGPYGGYRPYGCGLGYGYPPPPPYVPRYRNMDAYLEDDYDMNYVPRYRPRMSDALVEIEKEKLRRSVSPLPVSKTICTSSTLPQSDYMAKHFSPGMLQDEVERMRNRLNAMTYALDSPGQGPELYPEKSRLDGGKKYSSALEMAELPRLSNRRTNHIYPEDHYMKDNFRIKCLSHYKTTRSAAEYWKPKLKYADSDTPSLPLPTYSSKLSSSRAGDGSSKWEEPGTVYKRSTDRPFSKPNEAEEDDQKKERRRKKKSKEREETLAIESSVGSEMPSTEPVPSVQNEDPDLAELDEKERKKLEKKKRKAEREAAAKAAMEAELEALAEAEAELARLEAESAGIKSPQELKTESSTTSCPAVEQLQEPEPEIKSSEEKTDKCELPVVNSTDPECLPTDYESEPSILPTVDSQVNEDILQEHVEEPIETSEQHQEPVDECIEQVTETQDEPEVATESIDETEINHRTFENQSPAPVYDNNGELPTYKTEVCIWDDSVDEATNKGDDAPISADDVDPHIGEADPNEVDTNKQEVDVETTQETEEQLQQPVEEAELPEEIETQPLEQQEEATEQQQEATEQQEEATEQQEEVAEQQQQQEETSEDVHTIEDQEEQGEVISEEKVDSGEEINKNVEEAENDSQLKATLDETEPQDEAKEEEEVANIPLDTDEDIFASRED